MKKSIMFQGTASGVGKSLINTAFCRIFTEDGYNVAPFKSQNMALNSFITADGKEMGRAQVVQAEAANKKPDVRMNPILLKPTTDRKSQVIVMGKVKDNLDAVTYHKEKNSLREVVESTYTELLDENDIIVIEGAGSPAEINLRENDFVNMGMAKIAKSPVVIVGDIDRGGVFASLYGTIMLLTPEERAYVKGVIINKFRGDIEILKPGLDMLEELIGVPVLGVVPYTNLNIEDEDSLTDKFRIKEKKNKAISVNVIRLPHISNFTDFDIFETFDDVQLTYIDGLTSLDESDLIIIPGTKNTIEDLIFLRESGLEKQIIKAHKNNIPIIGICGGYQMLGTKIKDPDGVECGIEEIAGMSLIDLETIFEDEKVTSQVSAKIEFDVENSIFSGIKGTNIKGYEIHCGRSINETGAIKILEKHGELADYKEGSINIKGNVFGTYIHGIFDSMEFTKKILSNIRKARGLESKQEEFSTYEEFKENEYKKLAAHVRAHVDTKKIYEIMEKGI
ncbi:Cobyric acid synthase [Acetoanaerobium sticklandii]|uniref:Cobyric acid synthase n=1 Tax=Acetoanaerobium sticklandii (strain ATCC 12662 / DSM 519 / JCM 1433 / CCUG 9281 / NCIMB 10654 / HF) TaxID=499177 RepID=E3PXB5_ACESD|nr:cobyric acid synthase [Acetoanaerobium sticklandii]CBH21080.1 Cobyric acid synthase [Acetoanaerobium sticklandii]